MGRKIPWRMGADRTRGMDRVGGDGDSRTLPVTPELLDYVVDHGTSPVDDVLADLRTETLALGGAAGMQIGHDQGQLLTVLTRTVGARRAVEVGTFTGYSSICIARGLADDGRLLCCDVSEEWTAVARRAWERAGLDDRIELRLAPALDTLRDLPTDVPLDLVFIDADKPGYVAYWDELVPRVRPGGLLLVDNVLWGGRIVDEPGEGDGADTDLAALRAFNDHVVADPPGRRGDRARVRRPHGRLQALVARGDGFVGFGVAAAGSGVEALLEPVVGVGLVVERHDLAVARAAVEGDRLGEAGIGVQPNGVAAVRRGLGLELAEQPSPHAEPTGVRIDPEPLDLGGFARVEAQRPATDGLASRRRHEEQPERRSHVDGRGLPAALRVEPDPEPSVELAVVGLQAVACAVAVGVDHVDRHEPGGQQALDLVEGVHQAVALRG